MKKVVMCVLLCGVIAGCANKPDYQGQGEYFELTNVNLVERDLSKVMPTVLTQTDVKVKPKTVVKKRPVKALDTYVLLEGESYEKALRRWLRGRGYNNIAWSVTPSHESALQEKAEKGQVFTGSFKKVWDELEKLTGIPLNLVQTQQEKQKVAGVFDFQGNARLIRVSGSSLKSVIANVVKNYDMVWVDSTDNRRSWLAKDDYQFSADYYLITERDDIDTALTNILDGYPVAASIIESTGQVLIEEEL
ncbi:hypothetical protein VSAK1_26580 [Vibrio mediterranei AK1]|uniref:hypothetical protein n=1 Tax=Vibrio mediterranei TaxID=689 RepID=UPI0001542A4C|nr:hypothetical protein [Vibrio mediterranei]EDL52194.1 hypothetical protein VSAK1_26580 [Vibrio mediterranei AK1]